MVTKFAAVLVTGAVFVELQPDQEITPELIKQIESSILDQVQLHVVQIPTPQKEYYGTSRTKELSAHFEGEVEYVMEYQPTEKSVSKAEKKVTKKKK